MHRKGFRTSHRGSVASQRVAGPIVCDASRTTKSQDNGPFHRNVWQGLWFHMDTVLVCVCSRRHKNAMLSWLEYPTIKKFRATDCDYDMQTLVDRVQSNCK